MLPILAAAAQYRRTVAVMGSQMGKTASLLNLIGHKLDDDPAPVLYFGPTKSNIDGVIEPQVLAMIRSAESLAEKSEKGKRSKYVKRIAGVTLRLAWAGSPTELASQPAHTVLADEIDRMPPIPGEGDPVTLAEARIATYPDGRIVITSTPTEGNVDVEVHAETGVEHWKVTEGDNVPSPVWKLWQEGTRFEWAVPCPECSEYFVPRLRLLTWPKKCTPKAALKEARLACPKCGALLEDTKRHAMNARGLYVAPGQSVVNGEVVGVPPDSETATFWASGLMSPWRSWGQRAADYLRAVRSGDQDRLRTVINTGFGECFAFKGDAPSSEDVRRNCGPYKLGEVPEGARLLTSFVDVQKDRLVYVVRGWGPALESWLVDAGELHGPTELDPVWLELADVLERTYGGNRIRRMGIDSGYRPGDKWRIPDNQVYRFARRYRGLALPTKGRDRMTKPLAPSLIDVTLGGKTYRKGLTLWHLDTDYFKSWVHARLAWPTDQPGRFWLPADITEDYCQQVTAEARTVKPSGHAVWVRIRRENHFLDCEAGAAAMAISLGANRRMNRSGSAPPPPAAPPTPGEAPPAGAAPQSPPPPPPAAQAQRPPQRLAAPRRGGWVTGWRG
jgi:phage terminase large subunit GpA-like protein